jgi:hypothetical protein
MMDTTEKLRTTAIALFPEATSDEDCREIIDRLAAEKDLAGFRTLLRNTVLSDGSKRTYIKFTKVIPRNDFGTGWVVNITSKLFDVGYEDVAWRLTRIKPAVEGEDTTTESFPAELFKEALADDEETPG